LEMYTHIHASTHRRTDTRTHAPHTVTHTHAQTRMHAPPTSYVFSHNVNCVQRCKHSTQRKVLDKWQDINSTQASSVRKPLGPVHTHTTMQHTHATYTHTTHTQTHTHARHTTRAHTHTHTHTHHGRHHLWHMQVDVLTERWLCLWL
jgi:hypothetical protein